MALDERRAQRGRQARRLADSFELSWDIGPAPAGPTRSWSAPQATRQGKASPSQTSGAGRPAAPQAVPTQPREASREPGPRVSPVTLLLATIMLFTLGQTAGETAAYLTDSQNVNANTFSAATLFAPTGIAA